MHWNKEYTWYGILEKGYENALKSNLEERGFEIKQQYSIKVIYQK